MLKTRIITSILILALVALITFYFPNWAFSLLASSLIGLALFEFFNIVEKKNIFIYKYFGIIIGMLVPVIIYFQMGTEGYFTLEPFFIMIACLFIFVLQFIKRDSSQALASIAVTMFGLSGYQKAPDVIMLTGIVGFQNADKNASIAPGLVLYQKAGKKIRVFAVASTLKAE